MNEKCECYMQGELTNENYCNAKDCKYKTEKSIAGVLDGCSENGNVKGPFLDEIENVSPERIKDLTIAVMKAEATREIE